MQQSGTFGQVSTWGLRAQDGIKMEDPSGIKMEVLNVKLGTKLRLN